MTDFKVDRHASTVDIMKFFSFDHLPEGPLKETSQSCASLAHFMFNNPDLNGAELTTGLRKLLEAKDCFVRAALK